MIRYYLARLVMRYHTQPYVRFGKHSAIYKRVWNLAFDYLMCRSLRAEQSQQEKT